MEHDDANGHGDGHGHLMWPPWPHEQLRLEQPCPRIAQLACVSASINRGPLHHQEAEMVAVAHRAGNDA